MVIKGNKEQCDKGTWGTKNIVIKELGEQRTLLYRNVGNKEHCYIGMWGTKNIVIKECGEQRTL